MKMAQEVKYTPPDKFFIVPQSFNKLPSFLRRKIEGEDSSSGSVATILSVIDTPKLIKQSKPVALFRITGKNQEPLSGYHKIIISKNPKMESWLNSLCTEIPVLFMSLDGIIVEDNKNNYYQLIDRIKAQDVPCANPPEESELRVMGNDLKKFLAHEVNQTKSLKAIDPRKEESYLNTISALIDLLLVSKDLKLPAPYKNKEEIKGKILERFDKAKNLSKSNIEKIFGEITAHINKSKNIK